MKYDDEGENEADRQDNAERFKEEGNKHFKNNKYRWAIDCYTNGIDYFERKVRKRTECVQ